MLTRAPVSMTAVLAIAVEAFEDALARDPDADLADFLPDPSEPEYAGVLTELIRVDLERAWTANRPRRLEYYSLRFHDALARPEVLRDVAFEEYRQRRLAGEPADAAEYAARFGLDVSDWPSVCRDGPSGEGTVCVGLQAITFPLDDGDADSPPVEQSLPVVRFADLVGSEPETIDRLTRAARSFPAVGSEFLGFRLVGLLGRGAFGRVYLAHQADLGGRIVALKVGCDIFSESQTLAQLQHTNIVPIYSYHKTDVLQAVCMPYFGRVTLASVVKQISGRPQLPSSGRELRSTLEFHKDRTVRETVSDEPARSTSSHALAGLPGGPTHLPAGGRSADGWARLEGLSYVEAVLCLASQLADGLAHAHDRGIWHRDLKPANVLLTDEGRPMLLDFNLAANRNLRGTAAGAAVGGTLPYMAPEQLAAFRHRRPVVELDGRADVYSLGVILFELLTGRHPYPVHGGTLASAVDAMIADRLQPPPSVREVNEAVSPATESIVRKCLNPDPAGRYQRADELREDLERQLGHRPLQFASNPSVRERLSKWARRHPRLASSGTVAAIAGLALFALASTAFVIRERQQDLHARVTFADHRLALRDARIAAADRNRPHLDEALGQLRLVLDRYGIPETGVDETELAASPLMRRLPESERRQLREDLGETYYLMARLAQRRADLAADPAERERASEQAGRWCDLAERYAGDRISRAIREQRADAAERAGNAEATRLRAEAARLAPASARDEYLVGVLFAHQGRFRDALPHLESATNREPENYSAWFVRGTAHLVLEQNEMAAMCFGTCSALRGDHAPAWLNRGVAYARLRFFKQANSDLDRAVELDPTLTEAYLARAWAREGRRDLQGAVDDFTRALASGDAPVRAYFLRAAIHDKMGNRVAAAADRAEGMRRTPTDELSWIARAEARLAKDPQLALADVDEALKLNPESMYGLQLRAHILAERLNRPAEAVQALNRAVAAHPDYAPAVAGRGVMRARAGQREAAHRDAADALLRDTKAPNLYQVGCIYALTARTHPEDRREAFRLLWAGLKTGFALDIVDSDPDLAAVRDDPEFKRLVAAARARNSDGPR